MPPTFPHARRTSPIGVEVCGGPHLVAGTRCELAEVARCCARALREGDATEAAEALARARATQAGLDAWSDALVTGRDITRLSPFRGDRGGTLAAQARLQSGVDRATRNLRVLVRRVLFSLETGERLPVALTDELERLAAAVVDLLLATGVALERARVALPPLHPES